MTNGEGASAHCRRADGDDFTGLRQSAERCHGAGDRSREVKPRRSRGSYLASAEGARSIARKDMDVEFEGFTYPERTLNIEVAYDFPGTALPSETTFPIPSNTPTCFTGKARRIAGASISRPTPNEDENGTEAARGAADTPEEVSRHRRRFRNLRLQSLCRASARREKVPCRASDFVGRRRACEQPHRRHGPQQRRARRLQSCRQAGAHLAWRGAMKPNSIVTTGSAGISRSNTPRRRTMRNKRLLEERDPAVRKRNHEELRRRRKIPRWRANFCSVPRLSKACARLRNPVAR